MSLKSEKKYSSFYNIYVKAVGKPVVGLGAFGAVVFGEMSDQVFETSGVVEGYGINGREYIALTSIFDRMQGREDSDIICYFNNKTVVDQLNDRANVRSEVLERLISSLKESAGSFLSVCYENVSKDNSWIVRAKHLGEPHLYSRFGI